MIEFVPYIFQISLWLAVGLVEFVLCRKSGKLGFALVGIAFFLLAVPSIVNLALGGSYLPIRLMEQGYTSYEIGVFTNVYLNLLSNAFRIVFAIIVVAGLVKLST